MEHKINIEQLVKCAMQFKELREIFTNAIREIGKILEPFSKLTYQKHGYPLGKSNRGFNKW